MAGESEQFVIPQFIDVESKIIGPVTVRQFTLIMASGLVGAVIYKLFDFSLFLLLVIPLGIVTLLFAFVKINGQGLHYVALNWVQTLRRPSLRVWNKNKSDAELRAKIFKKGNCFLKCAKAVKEIEGYLFNRNKTKRLSYH